MGVPSPDPIPGACSTTVSASAFQAEDTGSIPVTRSILISAPRRPIRFLAVAALAALAALASPASASESRSRSRSGTGVTDPTRGGGTGGGVSDPSVPTPTPGPVIRDPGRTGNDPPKSIPGDPFSGGGGSTIALPFRYTADYAPLLKAYVDSYGRVDYLGMRKQAHVLRNFLARVAAVPPAAVKSWPQREQAAFYINAYNAIVLARVLDNWPPIRRTLTGSQVSVLAVPGAFSKMKSRVAGADLTLAEIETKILRTNWKDPRIRCALVQGTVSSPPLAAEPYTGANLSAQLTKASQRFIRDASKNTYSTAEKKLLLSGLFGRFPEDWAPYVNSIKRIAETKSLNKETKGVLGFVALYGDPEMRKFIETEKYKVTLLKLDTALNIKPANSSEGPEPIDDGKGIIRRAIERIIPGGD